MVAELRRAYSSAGQSARLISVRSVVRVHLSPLVIIPIKLHMGDQLSWESACLASRRSRVRLSYSPLDLKKGQICTLKTAYKKYDKIFKYLNQDIRGNCYKQSNVVMITHLRKQVKTNLEPTHVTLYMCGQKFIPVNNYRLVMLIRAQGGCLGTKSR